MPTLWIMYENCLAMCGLTFMASVITGKATDAPPSDVMPATMDPKTIVTDIYLCRPCSQDDATSGGLRFDSRRGIIV